MKWWTLQDYNQAVLAMVYPRVAFMEKNENSHKILCWGTGYWTKILVAQG